MRDFSFQVLQSTIPVGKGGSSFHQYLFTLGHTKLHIGTYLRRISYLNDTGRQRISPEHTVIRQLLLELNDEISAISCRFSPTLINAVNRIISVNLIVKGIDADIPLTFITVRVYHQITFSRFVISETENCGTRTPRHFGIDILIRQRNRIISRCCRFFLMGETGGTCFRLATQFTEERHQRHRTVVLRTSAHNPVGITKALQQSIRVIIGCYAFLLRVPRLRSPEVHSVGFEYRRKGLPVFFRIPAKQPRCMGRTGGGTYTSIDIG